ncbi:uncharacterized protein LOC142974977 [Anticarsia gemmatalis]|uniref:uncharacterized protein LOC142974977 n=1 Tax=Anticarsia gemmatalis TaxID=129554 RepID=UPI003F75E796
MCRFNEILFAVSVLCISNSWTKEMTEIEALGARPTHCTYEYAFDMYGANCAGLRLGKIPRLKGGIEILDFSDNKLQELHADTLSGYTGIRFLYLVDNHIYLIDEDAFSAFTYLETLDLSNNVIFELPNSILQLPSLRKLYLKGNPILHKSLNALTIVRPIKAPLELLDISDCKIKQLPNWGSLPQLRFYNISHNPLTSLSTDHFAPMCNLERLDLTESTNDMQLCSMKSAVMWFQAKKIFFQLEDYSKLNTNEFNHCPADDIAIHNVTYHRCKAEYLQVQSIKTSRRTWLTIGGGLAGFLIGFILLLWLMHRHNVAQTKTKAEKMKQATPANDPDKNATAILLNNVS